MKKAYRELSLRRDTLDLIEVCNKVVDHYMGEGLRLTLRQLYYQLVANHGYANTEKNYKRLSTIVSDGRLAGLMDWAAIEDRVRRPWSHQEYEDLQDLVDAAIYSYRLNRWDGQVHYVELWVEKDALAGVLKPLAEEFHVTLMVNRGYSSQSAMYESAKRFLASDREPLLYYLGDHDPSGEDMVRDIRDRLGMFGVDGLTVKKLGLTMAQVKKYNPPPNPAKITDPRAAAYIAAHGPHSWEVDALPPDVLQRLIQAEFRTVVDKGLMDEVKEREEEDKDWLKEVVAKHLKKDRG